MEDLHETGFSAPRVVGQLPASQAGKSVKASNKNILGRTQLCCDKIRFTLLC
jgi:hypothetical protein